ncbi:hypothetical protein GCM10010430_78110 [Kitasatospora cystarginea]|uniref:Uncharacterized protein n=1 Tax=Kitasatospora cystarginea TaxID=58350 RepID=A0ABP5S127_9ACTN
MRELSLSMMLKKLTPRYMVGAGDVDVTTAFAASYLRLPADQKRMFRLLGLHPGADFDSYGAAALYGTEPDEAERLLEALLDGHLLEDRGANRYAFHDLLRVHARTTANAVESPDARRLALNRLLDYYLATSTAAADLITAGRQRPDGKAHRPDGVARPPREGPRLAAAADAVAWMAAEHRALLAAAALSAEYQLANHTHQLSRNLAPYLTMDSHIEDTGNLREPATRVTETAR